MDFRGLRNLVTYAVLLASACSISASAQLASRAASETAAPAAAAGSMTPNQACAYLKANLRSNYSQPNLSFVKGGIQLQERRNKTIDINYADIQRVDFSPGTFIHADLYIHLKGKHGSYEFMFNIGVRGNDAVEQIKSALETMMAASGDSSIVCSDYAEDYTAALAAFEQQTAAWRALATKPAISDEVYKYRLLAEDAIKNKDLNSAAKYYELGVASGPTWSQGWYDGALVYAELNDYFDAALMMHHYVILMPNAPDVQAAKDNIILWEAKAPQPLVPSGPSARSKSSMFGATSAK